MTDRGKGEDPLRKGRIPYQDDPGLMEAWRQSFLSKVRDNEGLQAELLREAVLSTFAAGHIAASEGLRRPGQPRNVVLVIDGVFRAHLGHPSGREATVQYLRTGDVWGLVGLVRSPDSSLYKRLTFQALSPSRILTINGDTFAESVHSRPALAWALAEQLASVLATRTELLSLTIFSNTSVRLAQQLCQLVVHSEDGGWYVHASQQELADSVGTVREVVTRIISKFKDEGLVRYDGRSLEILDLDGLIIMTPPEY